MTAQDLAESVREAMWEDDHASKAMGMQVLAIGPGSSTVSMTVRQDMLNGHEICHGGLMTALADTAFAFACNAYNEVTVASGFDVNLISSARKGDVLTARCSEISKSGRTGVYDVSVRNQRDEAVVAFRGRSYTVKGKPVIEGLPMGRVAAALQNGPR